MGSLSAWPENKAVCYMWWKLSVVINKMLEGFCQRMRAFLHCMGSQSSIFLHPLCYGVGQYGECNDKGVAMYASSYTRIAHIHVTTQCYHQSSGETHALHCYEQRQSVRPLGPRRCERRRLPPQLSPLLSITTIHSATTCVLCGYKCLIYTFKLYLARWTCHC